MWEKKGELFYSCVGRFRFKEPNGISARRTPAVSVSSRTWSKMPHGDDAGGCPSAPTLLSGAFGRRFGLVCLERDFTMYRLVEFAASLKKA